MVEQNHRLMHCPPNAWMNRVFSIYCLDTTFSSIVKCYSFSESDKSLRSEEISESVECLLKCQETQMSYSGRESAMSDMSNARIGERQLSLDELKVTVL
ncbi:hypothetical protein CDAR_243151 [Caerostris darwini]|uniref:Uncharacterized protein n=1 Tax=Caerostris darwini TaxID=1538125 RepID=A0AAV4MMM4_9ARAC|nr:hypothetical protein CDAR_243151 [Caerostris darwini]